MPTRTYVEISTSSSKEDPRFSSTSSNLSSTTSQDAEWEKGFDELLRYKLWSGDANVPHSLALAVDALPSSARSEFSLVVPRWSVLGRWADAQRDDYRRMQRGQESRMTLEKRNLLTKAGFTWTYEPPRQAPSSGSNGGEGPGPKQRPDMCSGEKKVAAATMKGEEKESAAAAAAAGTAETGPQPPGGPPDEESDALSFCLASAERLREEYETYREGRRPTFLTPERVTALSHAGFVWDKKKAKARHAAAATDERPPSNDTGRDAAAASDAPPPDPRASWGGRLEELRRFKKIHGHANVPTRHDANPYLGVWVGTQRAQYQKRQQGKHSALTKKRIDALNELGFEWRIKKVSWDDRLQDLKAYKARHGHANIPIRCKENPALGVWVGTQRNNYRLMCAGKPSPMTAERVALLNEVGFVWVGKK